MCHLQTQCTHNPHATSLHINLVASAQTFDLVHGEVALNFSYFSWLKMASTLFEDPAPSARLVPPGAQAAPTHPRAQPEHLGSLQWAEQLASGHPKVEDFPLSGTCASAPFSSGSNGTHRRHRSPCSHSPSPSSPCPPASRPAGAARKETIALPPLPKA